VSTAGGGITHVAAIQGFHFAPSDSAGLQASSDGSVVLTNHSQAKQYALTLLAGDGGGQHAFHTSVVPMSGNSSHQIAPQWNNLQTGGVPIPIGPGNKGRYDGSMVVSPGLPTPALVALASARALPDRVSLTWYDGGRTLSLATVHRRREREEWATLG